MTKLQKPPGSVKVASFGCQSCSRRWVSARGQRGVYQKCQVCYEPCYPIEFFWQAPNKLGNMNRETYIGHNTELCGKCIELGYSCQPDFEMNEYARAKDTYDTTLSSFIDLAITESKVTQKQRKETEKAKKQKDEKDRELAKKKDESDKKIKNDKSICPIKLPKLEVSLVPIAWHEQGYDFVESQTFYLFPTSGGVCFIRLTYTQAADTVFTQATVSINTPDCKQYLVKYLHDAAPQFNAINNSGYTCSDWFTVLHDHVTGNWNIAMKIQDVVAKFKMSLLFGTEVGDSKVTFTSKSQAQPDGYVANTYGLEGSVQMGEIICDDTMVDVVNNHVTLVHQYQNIAPCKLITQETVFNFQSPKICISSVSGISSASYNNEHFGTLAVGLEGYGALVANRVVLDFPVAALTPTKPKPSVSTKFSLTAILSNGFMIKAYGYLNEKLVNKHKLPIGLKPVLLSYLFLDPNVYQFTDAQAIVIVFDISGNVIAEDMGLCVFDVVVCKSGL